MIRRSTAAALLLVAGLFPAALDAEEARRRREAIHIEHDLDSFVSTVRVDAHDGRIAWRDMLRGVSRARGYDDQALEGALPDWSWRADGRVANWMVRRTDWLLGDDIRVKVEPAPNSQQQPQLVIELDRQALLASDRRLKEKLRNVLLPSRYGRKSFGLKLDEKWEEAAAPDSNLVVFVHGLNSHPETVNELCAIARRNQLACGVFHYPNDQPIETSGELLSAELKQFAAKYPGRRVALVTHSMGGLVARWAVENPALDPGNVNRLIMIAPPNQGSALAQFAFGLDIWEYIDQGQRPEREWLFFSTIEDGLAEATVDLQPGSVFLTKLNRRPRHPDVAYSIFLGTGAPCTQDDLDNVCAKLQWGAKRSKWCRFFGSKLDRSIADLAEVVGGEGDGAVAVKRGRLKGVSDVTLLPFDHLSVLRGDDEPGVKQLYSAVLQRLK